MAESFKKLGAVTLPNNTTTTVYTQNSPVTAVIVKRIVIVNNDTVDREVKIFQDGVADVNVILPLTTIDAGGHADFDGTEIISSVGGTLRAFVDNVGTTNKVTVAAFGVELSP